MDAVRGGKFVYYNMKHAATTATHCNTLQNTAQHCKKLQHHTTHCNTLQYTATHQHYLGHSEREGKVVYDNAIAPFIVMVLTDITTQTATHCSTIQQIATICAALHAMATLFMII